MATLIDNDPLGIETAPRVDPLGIERKSDPLGVERSDPLGIDTERNSRIDAGLDFFRQSHPELYPEQGPGLEQIDSLTPATPQIERLAPVIPPELGQTPERPNTLENAMSGVGQPLEEPPGITPRMESPENLSPLEVLRKGTSMPAPRISDSEAATLMPPWLAPHVAGVQRSMADFVDFATSPAGIATTLTSGAASVDAVAGHLVSKATATAFALDMAQNLPDQFDAAVNAIQRGDKAEATRAMVNGAAALLMIGHAAKVNAPAGVHPETALKGPEGVSDVSGQASESLPQPAVQAQGSPIDVTGDLINELQGGLNKNQIVRPDQVPEAGKVMVPSGTGVETNPFEALPEAKPETPAETPGDIVRKAVEAQPLTLPKEEPKAESWQDYHNYISKSHEGLSDQAVSNALRRHRKALAVDPDAPFVATANNGQWVIIDRPFEKPTILTQNEALKQLNPVAWASDAYYLKAEKPPQAVTGVETPGTRETLPSAETVATESAQPSGEKPVEQAPAPERFENLSELLKFREQRRQEEIGLYEKQMGLTRAEAEQLQGIMARDGSTERFEKRIGPEKAARMQQWFDTSPLNKVGSGFEMWDYDKRYNPEELQSANKEDLARSLVQVTQHETEPSVTSDRFIYAATAAQRFKEAGGTKSDLARELDKYSTRNSGSQGDKAELFKIAGKRLMDFVSRQGIDLPDGEFGKRTGLVKQFPKTNEEVKADLQDKVEQRGPLGGNLSTFGLFDPEAYRPAFEELSDRSKMLFRWGDKQREKVIARYRRGDTRNFIARTKDGSDSTAKLMGQRGANIILHELNRSFDVKPEDVGGDRSQLREMALTMRIESGGEKSALQEMRYRLTDAKAEGVNLVWKRKALKAIDFAEQHWDKLEPAATEYQRLTDAENAFENANGIKTLYRKGGYVFHAQDVDESFGMPSTGQAQEAAGAPAPFRHIRDYQTYAEAIANGVSPVSLNAIDLLQKRLELGQRLIRYGDWADEFQNLTDPHTQLPIARPPEVRTRADGTEDMTAPAGYQLVHFAGKDFALHNGYAGLFGDLTKPSWMQGTEFRQNVMKTFSGMKHATLLLDTYHMARLAFWNSMTRLGLPTYARGVTILDNTTPELQKMIANGEIPREWGENLVQRKQVLERMVRQGLNVGSVGDNLYTDFLQNIPGIGTFNKWLFGKYQRGAMAEVALIEHDRQKQMFPDLGDDQLAARVAKDVNTRFGNLQSQSWIKSRTGQDLARIIFLAPQWNESLIRAELGAMRQLAAAPGQSFRAGRPAMGALARGVGTAMLGIFVGNQLINMATRGHPTWENPEEEAGSKISAYIPDLLGGPGFFLNPMSVPMEITNLLWRASERHGGDLTLALRDFAAGRFSGLAKGVWTAMTGYTPMGQPVKGGWSRVGESIAQAAPLPISGGPVVRGIAQAVTGENREKFPGEIQKQAMQSFGVKTEPVPDAQRRMYDLAAKFKQSKGIVEPPTREMSFYGDLTSAVKTGNMKAAGEALDKILTLAKGSGEPHTLDDVDKYYRQYPQRTFTNNKSMEGAFKRTLNPEQLRVYNQSVKDRQNIAATVQRLIAERRR